MATKKTDKRGKQDRIGIVLYLFYLVVLISSVVIFGKLIVTQVFWEPKPEIARKLTQPVKRVDLEPVRGKILARDGRPIAMSYPRYQLYIDCGVNQEGLKDKPKSEKEDSARVWKAKADGFAVGLAEAFKTKGHDSEYYKALLYKNYDSGSRYLKLGSPVEKETLEKLKTYPLINESRYKGGVWSVAVPTRRYPYGSLARRTIGNVTENDVDSWYSGIEGKFNYVLHGEPGRFYLKKTDRGFIRDYDSTYVEAVNGNDIRTTLDVDYQDMADRLLRKYIVSEAPIEAACFILMEVKTGAIRAMVNLERDKKGQFEEINNIAVLRSGEPGSIFKTTTLMTCIEDGIIKSLEQTVPGKDGMVQVEGYNDKKSRNSYPADKHFKDWTKEFHSTNIPIWYCMQVSSNNCFRYLAHNYYETRPKEFTNHLYTYNLGKSFDFDVYETVTTPSIKDPDSGNWHKKDLGQISMGYAVTVTPLHMITYYNAIANGGKMMRPYLVESIEKDGKVIETLGKSILNASICKPQTAKMVTEALCKVTESGTKAGRGTGWRLEKAKCKVAGKTGTADIFTGGKYVQPDGSRAQQGSFIGFFPAEDPQYTVLCTIYTGLTRKEYAGGVIPASVIGDFVNYIYDIDPYWNESI